MQYSLLADEKFVRGFHLKGLNSIRDGHAPVKTFATTEKDPVWLLCQWNSKHNLTDGVFTVSEGEYSVSDVSKRMTVRSGARLSFALNAAQEYTAPRGVCDPWPHLLIEQEITQNNKICDFKKLTYHASFQLEEFENFMGDSEREHHTTQFVWVLTLKDDNPASPSYNHFIWVLLPIFDSRYQMSPAYMSQDHALPDGEFIYTFAADTVLPKSLWTREKVDVNFDLMPHISTILACAQERGFMQGTKEEDLIVSSTNMGFEITGTYRCKINVEGLGITVERR